MSEEKVIEKVEELRRRINPPDLVINRVPKKELEWFKKTANDEFEGDYGMLLKWLIQGYMPPEELFLQQKIEELENRINRLESVREEKNIISTGTGRVIHKRTEEKNNEPE
jgi:hypothetical protein